MSESAPHSDDSTSALFALRDYRLFWVSRAAGALGGLIQSVALGWQVYAVARETMDVARSSFMLGMVGLVSFLPVLLLTLPAGEAVDRYNRRRVLTWCLLGQIAVVTTLTALSFFRVRNMALLLSVAALYGCARVFFAPASSALGPMLVPRTLLPRAIAWNSLAWQTSAVVGPAIGGILVAVSPTLAFGVSVLLYSVSVLVLVRIRTDSQPVAKPGSRWSLMKEGLHYVWTNQIVFGAISLDLCAVLLGGATALLPAFARDVLHVGASGFGVLRAAPAAGATVVALYLAANPIRRRAGVIMFSGVGIFALATIGFGFSRNLALSAVMLGVLGGADMISVFVRQTLVQLVTPDAMRGRVGAVSTLFIGASNELGEFESGFVARFIGPVRAVIMGGVGALGVTIVWIRLFPTLWKSNSLE
ncbi:MAG: MFS transporter [Deltaproteobacteria bacterium]|nr:MFS transporter [Deltaproteobacteria bacterium]